MWNRQARNRDARLERAAHLTSAKLVPAANSVTPIEDDKQTHQQDLEREKCLLFVACTRAREELLVTWHGEPSPFLTTLI